MEKLPVELKDQISQYLTPRELSAMFMSERGFEALSHDEKFWKSKYYSDFPEDIEMSWKERYEQRWKNSLLAKVYISQRMLGSNQIGLSITLQGNNSHFDLFLLKSDIETMVDKISRKLAGDRSVRTLFTVTSYTEPLGMVPNLKIFNMPDFIMIWPDIDESEIDNSFQFQMDTNLFYTILTDTLSIVERGDPNLTRRGVIKKYYA